jgi:uncharacterized RDD family membrane protein YckC
LTQVNDQAAPGLRIAQVRAVNDGRSVDVSDAVSPGLPRRLAAMFYDGLLLLALLLVTTALAVAANRGEAIPSDSWLFPMVLVLVWAGFYVGFWSRGGQTLGMRAWRLRLVTRAGAPVGPPRALLRLAAAVLSALPLGLGYLWVLLDRDRLAWHDRLSGTRLVVLEKPRRR